MLVTLIIIPLCIDSEVDSYFDGSRGYDSSELAEEDYIPEQYRNYYIDRYDCQYDPKDFELKVLVTKELMGVQPRDPLEVNSFPAGTLTHCHLKLYGLTEKSYQTIRIALYKVLRRSEYNRCNDGDRWGRYGGKLDRKAMFTLYQVKYNKTPISKRLLDNQPFIPLELHTAIESTLNVRYQPRPGF